MVTKRKQEIEKCKISQLKTYDLCGYPQKVLLEGRYESNPILVYLHGGPGSPLPFNAGCRGLFPKLTERFLMVYWDQLGCGINNRTIDNTFSIDSYVSMTVALIKALRTDYPNTPINLLGVSWGSILAAKAAEQVPQLIHRVAVCGQVVKNLAFNEEVFTALSSANLPTKTIAQLEKIKAKQAHTKDDMMVMSKLINKYTDGYQVKSAEKASLGNVLWGLLTSPDYSLKDFMALIFNGIGKNQSLFEELVQVDLTDTLHNISVPYFLMQGSCDIVTSTKTVEEFLKNTENSNFSYHKLPNSGHMPGKSAMDYIMTDGLGFLLQKG